MLIACKQSLPVIQVDVDSNVEIVAVDIRNDSAKSLRIIVCYNPHSNNMRYLKELLWTIEHIIQSCEYYVIVGDLNIDPNTTSNTDPALQILNNFINFHSCKQAVDFPTRENRQLDYIFTSKNIQCTSECLPPVGRSDHVSIRAVFNYTVSRHISGAHSFSDFKNTDYTSIANYLMDSDCLNVKKCTSVLESFENFLYIAKEQFILERKLYIHKNKVISIQARKLYKQMRFFYHKFCLTKHNIYLDKYKLFKSKYRKVIYNSQISFEKHLIKQNCKSNLYKFLKSRTCDNTITITLESPDGNIISDPITIANLFNKYFSSVYSMSTFDSSQYNYLSNSDGDLIIISPTLIGEALSHLKYSRGAGFDEIPVIFYQRLQPYLLPILSKLFTEIANNCNIPEKWTTYIITPLFKKNGSKSQTKNYRPIAVSCSIYKIFETCLYILLKDKLRSKIAPSQYGFMPKSSTFSNLIDTYYKIFKAVDCQNSIDLITIDFCKAFDKVDIRLLLDKLLDFDISPSFCRILGSLMKNRHHIVKYHNFFLSL